MCSLCIVRSSNTAMNTTDQNPEDSSRSRLLSLRPQIWLPALQLWHGCSLGEPSSGRSDLVGLGGAASSPCQCGASHLYNESLSLQSLSLHRFRRTLRKFGAPIFITAPCRTVEVWPRVKLFLLVLKVQISGCATVLRPPMFRAQCVAVGYAVL